MNVPTTGSHEAIPLELTTIPSVARSLITQGLPCDHNTGNWETLVPSEYTPVAVNCAWPAAVGGLTVIALSWPCPLPQQRTEIVARSSELPRRRSRSLHIAASSGGGLAVVEAPAS